MNKLPIIRHIRWMILKYKVERWYDEWGRLGMHSGNKSRDYLVLDAIWRGEA